MHLVEFAEQTVVIAKDQPEYIPLPAHRFADDPQGRIACCWRMTWKERMKILFTGLLWHEVLTFNTPLQPQKLSTDKPNMKGSNFDVTLVAGNWTIEVDNKARYGYFEHGKTGTGGGLWFDEGKVLIDYDGVFELPEPIASALEKHGYIIEELENVD